MSGGGPADAGRGRPLILEAQRIRAEARGGFPPISSPACVGGWPCTSSPCPSPCSLAPGSPPTAAAACPLSLFCLGGSGGSSSSAARDLGGALLYLLFDGPHAREIDGILVDHLLLLIGRGGVGEDGLKPALLLLLLLPPPLKLGGEAQDLHHFEVARPAPRAGGTAVIVEGLGGRACRLERRRQPAVLALARPMQGCLAHAGLGLGRGLDVGAAGDE